jgi:hypothetical protein
MELFSSKICSETMGGTLRFWGYVMSEVNGRNRSQTDDSRLDELERQVNDINDRILEEKPWRLGPLRVKGAVDIIALITFFIAIGNIFCFPVGLAQVR